MLKRGKLKLLIKDLRHKVIMKVADRHGNKKEILRTVNVSLPKKIIKLIFGEFTDFMLIVPGDSVEGFYIEELPPKDKKE